MDPAVRAAYTPMSDTRFEDLMPATWNNNGFSQGTGSAAFLKGDNWGIYEGRLAVGIMGIAFGDTPEGSRIDMISITLDSIYRNPQLARIRLLLVCDGCKLLTKDGAKNAYRAGRVTAESLGKYVKYKDNLRREIEAARYP